MNSCVSLNLECIECLNACIDTVDVSICKTRFSTNLVYFLIQIHELIRLSDVANSVVGIKKMKRKYFILLILCDLSVSGANVYE